MRSPDGAWVEKSRWDNLTQAQREKFLPLCPETLSGEDVLPAFILNMSKIWAK